MSLMLIGGLIYSQKQNQDRLEQRHAKVFGG